MLGLSSAHRPQQAQQSAPAHRPRSPSPPPHVVAEDMHARLQAAVQQRPGPAASPPSLAATPGWQYGYGGGASLAAATAPGTAPAEAQEAILGRIDALLSSLPAPEEPELSPERAALLEAMRHSPCPSRGHGYDSDGYRGYAAEAAAARSPGPVGLIAGVAVTARDAYVGRRGAPPPASPALTVPASASPQQPALATAAAWAAAPAPTTTGARTAAPHIPARSTSGDVAAAVVKLGDSADRFSPGLTSQLNRVSATLLSGQLPLVPAAGADRAYNGARHTGDYAAAGAAAASGAHGSNSEAYLRSWSPGLSSRLDHERDGGDGGGGGGSPRSAGGSSSGGGYSSARSGVSGDAAALALGSVGGASQFMRWPV
jgi:hypothetical protein